MTAERASTLIASQFPPLATTRATPLAAGSDNDAFLVESEWVFRFPRNVDAAARLERELRLLPHIAGYLTYMPGGILSPAKNPHAAGPMTVQFCEPSAPTLSSAEEPRSRSTYAPVSSFVKRTTSAPL